MKETESRKTAAAAENRRDAEVATKPAIVFVYNADSGLFNTLTDIAHKIFAPETYECNLCAITYGNFTIRKEWQEFLGSLDVELEFLHRDEFLARYGLKDIALPAVFCKSGETLELWISAAEINACEGIDDLKRIITAKLRSPVEGEGAI